jgi:hypothetical protein
LADEFSLVSTILDGIALPVPSILFFGRHDDPADYPLDIECKVSQAGPGTALEYFFKLSRIHLSWRVRAEEIRECGYAKGFDFS